MLLFADPSRAATDLAAGQLSCPHPGCDGRLGPWGHARVRFVRVGFGRRESHRSRRAICRSCRRTQVLAWARSYPRRVDTVETVGAALLAAASGLGHRSIAAQLDVPAPTVRDWLRRATANAEFVRADATVAMHALDARAGPIAPTGSLLGDMLEAVGSAVSAAVRRLGPVAAPWQLATVITGAGILAARPSARWRSDI